MVVKNKKGLIIGDVALMMELEKPCMYHGRHGTLFYGYYPLGKNIAKMAVCDRHLHNWFGKNGVPVNQRNW